MTGKAKKEKISLKAEARKILGRKVKALRKENKLPANVYGKKIKSLAISLEINDFISVYDQAGETGVIELKVGKEEKIRPILISNVQFDPVSDKPLHADFHQVDLKETITANIPVELIGEAPAASQKIGVLIQLISEVEVEALPTNLPEKFELDISSLAEIEAALKISDLKIPSGVKMLTSANEVVAKIEPPAKEEEKPVSTQAPAEGEEKPEETSGGEKPAAEEKDEPASGSPKEEEKSTDQAK